MNGDTLAVSQLRYMSVNRVAIHERHVGGTDQWGLSQLISSPTGVLQDGFGSAVAVHNDLAVITASNATGNGEGKAFVFKRHSGGANEWGLVAELTSPDPGKSDGFGASVLIQGDLVFVGSRGDGFQSLGAVYVYRIPEPGTAVLLVTFIIGLPFVACRRRVTQLPTTGRN